MTASPNTQLECAILGQVEIPELGDFAVVAATNAKNCFDPRGTVPVDENANWNSGPAINFVNPMYGEIRTPGGTFGDAMALTGAYPDIPLLTSFRLATTRETGMLRRLPSMHRHDQAFGFKGCGHAAKAASEEHEQEYGIPATEVRTTLETIEDLGRIGMLIRSTVVQGDFPEKLAFVKILSMDKTLVPISSTGNRLIRFDQTRQIADLWGLAGFATAELGSVISGHELIKSAIHQRDVTLGHLALGIPKYIVDLDVASPIAWPDGFVTSPK